MKKNQIDRFMTWARNFRSAELFAALENHSRGDVLDVGGWDFFLSVRDNPRIAFNTWTSLEEGERLLETPDGRYRAVTGDGEKMAFPDASFDTVLNIQVLEHTFDPLAMVREISRVLRPGGVILASGLELAEIEQVKTALPPARDVRTKGNWALIVA